MTRTLALPWAAGLRAVWCSTERKARDRADILAAVLSLPMRVLAGLGENNRSATGYLPQAEFEAVADKFFASPTQSVRGWERALDAQRRIVAAMEEVLAASPPGGVAVVSHGGVGTLLLCHLTGVPIAREHDQPPNNGGNYFAFNRACRTVLHGWRPVDESS